MKRKILLLSGQVGLMLVLTGCVSHYRDGDTDYLKLTEDELRLTREQLENCWRSRKNLTQVEMTRWSADELELAYVERYLIEHQIRNQPGYDNIEKQFMADCERWNKKLEEEGRKPSDYAGGSLEPMDRNLRMTDLVRKRIAELKTKWLTKP